MKTIVKGKIAGNYLSKIEWFDEDNHRSFQHVLIDRLVFLGDLSLMENVNVMMFLTDEELKSIRHAEFEVSYRRESIEFIRFWKIPKQNKRKSSFLLPRVESWKMFLLDQIVDLFEMENSFLICHFGQLFVFVEQVEFGPIFLWDPFQRNDWERFFRWTFPSNESIWFQLELFGVLDWTKWKTSVRSALLTGKTEMACRSSLKRKTNSKGVSTNDSNKYIDRKWNSKKNSFDEMSSYRWEIWLLFLNSFCC